MKTAMYAAALAISAAVLMGPGRAGLSRHATPLLRNGTYASASAFAQNAPPLQQKKPSGCTITRAENNDRFQTKPQAAIYGATVKVPRMRVRAYDVETQRPLEIQRLRVLYAWDWLDYPYPGREFGGWSSAWDTADCAGAHAGATVQVPAFDIQPRGWYGGRYALYPFARKPHATRIVLETLVTDSCERKVEMSPGDVARLARDAIVIQTSCTPQASASERKGTLHFERAR